MNRQDREELIEVVNRINEQLQEQLYSEKYGMEPWIWLEVHIGPNEVIVMFLGECIYNSENDEREWTEGETISAGVLNAEEVTFAHYEPVEPFLRKQIMTLLGKLQQIQL